MNFITKEKPYNTLTAYNLYKYNSKVAKIALNADFTCPNKDGKKDMVAVAIVLGLEVVILQAIKKNHLRSNLRT